MIRYDNSLPFVADMVHSMIGPGPLNDGLIAFLRDASGTLTILDKRGILERFDEEIRRAATSLKPYLDTESPVLYGNDPSFDFTVSGLDFYSTTINVRAATITARIGERRIIGSDWLRSSPASEALPPIYAFCSLKGGVGRSTALSIAADSFSRLGMKVLAVDFDLEAPGLGSLLLPPENLPEYGTLDFFAEHQDSSFHDDFNLLFEASPFFTGGAPVYVAPAIGSLSRNNPANVLGKLARAYVEDYSEEGLETFAIRARNLISGLANANSFDVILIDARAGLHETVAAPILHLGATVLLFASPQKQTFEGYSYLLAQFSNLPAKSALAQRLQMVHSKAHLHDLTETTYLTDLCHRLFSTYIYDRPAQTPEEFESGEISWFNIEDSDAPHYPWVIGDTANYRIFSPGENLLQLDPDGYSDAFGSFSNTLVRHFFSRVEPQR